MNIRQMLLAIAAGAMLAGGVHAASQAEFDAALSAAKAAQSAAKKAGNEWRDTGKMIDSAVKVAGEGDFAKAVKLAQAAEFQGKMAQEQAAEQVNAGNPGYLY